MRVFILSVALLLLTLTGVGINYIYINEAADELNARIDALPDLNDPGCVSAVEAIVDYWEKQADIVGLSVSYPVIDRVGEQAAALVACAKYGTLSEFYTAVALLRDAVSDMQRLERFSIGNLF